jgi:hypothetical protein
MAAVTRDEVRELLIRWRDGGMTPDAVDDWATARFGVPEFEPEDEIVNTVLAHLDLLDVNLMTVDDIPTLLLVLDVPAERSAEAHELLRLHMESIDLPSRMARFRDDPYYAPFCQPE